MAAGEKSVQVGDILDIPFPLAFQGGSGKDNALFEFYSAPALADGQVFLVHFPDLEQALAYFRSIEEQWQECKSRFQKPPWKIFSAAKAGRSNHERQRQNGKRKALARRVKDHVLGKRHDFSPWFSPDSRPPAEELRQLGIASPRIAGSGGVAFSGKLEDAWRANLGAGTVSRILMRLCEFKATGFGEFRAKLADFAWELHLADQARVAFSIQAGRSRLWHEGKLAEEAARAIAERLAAYGRRAQFIEKADGDAAGRQTVFLRLDENRCQASLDTSGELLYRRGHGKFTEQAPLRETLACCILHAAGIERYRIVIDPFCGSGTFALEAAAIFSGRPVNGDRSFAFQGWPCFRPARFQHLKDELERNEATSSRGCA